MKMVRNSSKKMDIIVQIKALELEEKQLNRANKKITLILDALDEKYDDMADNSNTIVGFSRRHQNPLRCVKLVKRSFAESAHICQNEVLSESTAFVDEVEMIATKERYAQLTLFEEKVVWIEAKFYESQNYQKMIEMHREIQEMNAELKASSLQWRKFQLERKIYKERDIEEDKAFEMEKEALDMRMRNLECDGHEPNAVVKNEPNVGNEEQHEPDGDIVEPNEVRQVVGDRADAREAAPTKNDDSKSTTTFDEVTLPFIQRRTPFVSSMSRQCHKDQHLSSNNVSSTQHGANVAERIFVEPKPLLRTALKHKDDPTDRSSFRVKKNREGDETDTTFVRPSDVSGTLTDTTSTRKAAVVQPNIQTRRDLQVPSSTSSNEQAANVQRTAHTSTLDFQGFGENMDTFTGGNNDNDFNFENTPNDPANQTAAFDFADFDFPNESRGGNQAEVDFMDFGNDFMNRRDNVQNSQNPDDAWANDFHF